MSNTELTTGSDIWKVTFNELMPKIAAGNTEIPGILKVGQFLHPLPS